MNFIRKWFYRHNYLRKRKKERNMQIIALEIGYYYLDKVTKAEGGKFPTDADYSEAYRQIEELRITNIEKRKNNIVITLCRPGLLIGKHGSNIEALKKYLKGKVSFGTIEVIENRVLQWLYPMMPDEVDEIIDGI